MPNEIYHRSEWGNPKAEGFGDVYFDAAATNKLYNHSDYYENSDGTDKILRDIPNKASIVLTPTAYSDGSLNTVLPTDGNGDFDFSRGSSATRVNEQGLIEDVASGIPRIDYTGGQGALLLEPQSTNLLPYSEDFSQWIWGGNSNPNNTTRVDNQSSPDGGLNASLFTRNSGTSGWFSPTNITVSLNNTFTYSIFVKKNNSSTIELNNVSNYPQSKVVYNIDLNTFTTETNATGNSVNYGDGWYRISMTFEHTNSGNTSAQIRHTLEEGKSMFVFGAQAEQKSYATSYIPTEGSTVTRSADVANNSGNADLINSTEGVLYAEIAALNDDTQQQIGIYGNSISKQIRLEITNSVIRGALFNGAFQAILSSTQTVTDFNKIAFKYKENDFALWVNGIEVATDSVGLTFPANDLDRVNLTSQGGSSLSAQANVKSVAVFKEALTDAELQALTT